MKTILNVTPRVNKRNGQINISLPRKNIPKKLADNILEVKRLRIGLEDFYND